MTPVYQVLKPNAGSTEAVLRFPETTSLATATTNANSLTPDEEIRVELRTGSGSKTVLVIAKV